MVAPLVGAWIEIEAYSKDKYSNASLLSWERGLKSRLVGMEQQGEGSLLSWERGLKYAIY